MAPFECTTVESIGTFVILSWSWKALEDTPKLSFHDSAKAIMHSTHDSADEPGDTPPEKPRGVVAYVGPASNSSEELNQDSADCMSANDLNHELQNDSNDNLQVQSTGSLSNEGNTIKPQVDQNLEGKDALIEHKAPATEARIKKPPLGGDSDTIGTTGASTVRRVWTPVRALLMQSLLLEAEKNTWYYLVVLSRTVPVVFCKSKNYNYHQPAAGHLSHIPWTYSNVMYCCAVQNSTGSP